MRLQAPAAFSGKQLLFLVMSLPGNLSLSTLLRAGLKQGGCREVTEKDTGLDSAAVKK